MENVLLTILVIGVAIFALRRGLPGFFCSQGYAHQDRGEYESAEQWFLKALRFEETVQRITGKRMGLAIVCTSLGLLYHQQRRMDEAVRMFTRAISIYSDIGRIDDLAAVYGSLGKLYFDEGELASAERALSEALAIYSRRGNAQEAMDTTTALLDLISERRQNTAKASKYENIDYGFSLVIPAGWVKERLVEQFSRTGGQIAVSHKSRRATLNLSVGPPDRPEWTGIETRAIAVRNYLGRVPGRIGTVEVRMSSSLGGELNTVSAEYEAETDVGGVSRRRRNGFISVIHNGLEYVIQWSAEDSFEDQAKSIVESFRFTGQESRKWDKR